MSESREQFEKLREDCVQASTEKISGANLLSSIRTECRVVWHNGYQAGFAAGRLSGLEEAAKELAVKFPWITDDSPVDFAICSAMRDIYRTWAAAIREKIAKEK